MHNEIVAIPYGGKLWHSENLANLANDQKFSKFSPSKYLLHLIASRDELNGMSILNYFKCVPVEPTTDKRLPEPSGPLSKSVPTNAIKLANAEVLNLTQHVAAEQGHI